MFAVIIILKNTKIVLYFGTLYKFENYKKIYIILLMFCSRFNTKNIILYFVFIKNENYKK